MDAIDIGIYLVYILFFIALGVSVVLPLFALIKDPKALIRVGIAIAGGVALFFIAYAMSSDAVTIKYTALGVDNASSKLIGAGLIVLYLFLFISIAGMIVSEVLKFFK